MMLAVVIVAFYGSRADAQSAVVVPASTKPVKRVVIPPGRLLMAGNVRSGIWMVVPTWFGKSGHRPGFVILQHSLNRQQGGDDIWRQVNRQVLVGVPRAMAVLAGTVDGKEVSSAYVMFSGGLVWAYGKDLQQSQASLPRSSQPVATVGNAGGLYALVWGRPPMAASDRSAAAKFKRFRASGKVVVRPVAGTVLAKPSVTSQPQVPAKPVVNGRGPTTAPAALLRPAQWLLYEFNGVRWHYISAPGLAIPLAKGRLQSTGITLVWQANRLWAFWKSPQQRQQINAQYLPVGKQEPARWSQVLGWNTGSPLGTLLALSVDGRLLVLWASGEPNGDMKIQGAQVQAFGKKGLEPTHVFKPVVMTCGHHALSRGLIGAAADGDSVAVVCGTVSGVLRQVTLDRRGRIITPTFKLQPRPASPASPENIQSLMMVALMVLLALSLWQRQQVPPPGTLPKGMQIARLYVRIPAALIDLAIPICAVAVVFGAFTEPLFVAMLRHWTNVYSSPVLLAHESSIWWMLGLYVGHVGLGECIFGRSIGKAVFRLRVVNMAGGRPAVGPVAIRNFMRLPELALPVLLIFMVVSTDRQRLGDLLARTLVVQVS
ncbi:MAG: RDD family protein [Phycisphaerae bacterium]|nr:RDD family protein [Phycisphaerae bacterium]